MNVKKPDFSVSAELLYSLLKDLATQDITHFLSMKKNHTFNGN